MRILLTALVLALATLPQATRAAAEPGLRAVYTVTRSEENPAAESGPEASVGNSVLTVRLTQDVLALRNDEVERIFDFTTGRVTVLDHAQRSAYRFSSYAEPGFRELELRNRAMMTRMMAALGQKSDLVDAEAELGMLGEPPAKLKMKEVRRGEARVFLLNKQEMVTFVPEGMELPRSLAKALDRLYLLEAQIHPKVRAALATPAQLPARISYGFRQFGSRTTITWTLQESAIEDMDLSAAADEYPVGPIGTEAVLQAAWRVRTGQAGAAPTADDYRARIDGLVSKGRGFEGFLVGMEAAFALHPLPEDWLKQTRQVAGPDPRMTAFLRSLEIEASYGDAKEALALLEPLDAASLDGGTAIHIQRANQYVRLGNGTKALEEFGRALAVNPFLAGPLHDAGRIYFNGYAMPLAWSCWDAARVLAPGDPAMKDVTDMEEALRRKHPEFF